MSRTRTTTTTDAGPVTLAGLLVGEYLREARMTVGPLLDCRAAGHTDLPAELLDLVRGAHRLANAYRTSGQAPSLAQVGGLLTADMEAAAVAGTDLPGSDLLAATAGRAEIDQAYRLALADAHEAMLRRAVFFVVEHADDLITGNLRPAHTAALVEARAALEVYGQHGHDPEQLLRSGNLEAQQAYMGMEQAAQRYRSLVRAGMSLVKRSGQLTRDHGEQFAEMCDLRRLKPSEHGPAPWPDDERDRLAWLLEQNAALWLPTPGERDAAHAAHYNPTADIEQRTQDRDRGAELVIGA